MGGVGLKVLWKFTCKRSNFGHDAGCSTQASWIRPWFVTTDKQSTYAQVALQNVMEIFRK